MKLVLVYDWYVEDVGNGTDTLPFEYESKEQAFVDFFELKDATKAKNEEYRRWENILFDKRISGEITPEKWLELRKEKDYRDYPSEFRFAGGYFDCYSDSVCESNVKFYTLEEWFETYK